MSDGVAPGVNAENLRRLLDAVMAIGSELELSAVLLDIAEAARELSQATYGALGVLDATGLRLAEFHTVGIDDDTRARIGSLPEGRGVLGLLIVDPKPLRLHNVADHPESAELPPNHPRMTSFLGVPIQVRGRAFGNLYLCDKRDGVAFTDDDEAMVVALAAAAGSAIENARLHARVGELALFEDRERIARDLHDTVIQRLFAVGLGLQGLTRRVSDPEVLDRITAAVDDLDTTIRQVRSAIFELHTARLPGRSARQEVLDVCAESGRGLGFEPHVRLEGAIDVMVDDSMAEDLLAVLREALANVARHSGAGSTEVILRAADGRLTLEVRDDGKGPGDGLGGRGVENMRTRAARLGGEFSISHRPGGGTEMRWSVPFAVR